MARTATVQVQVDPALKAEAELVFSGIGMTTAEAIRLFLEQVVSERCLPFELHIPNEETKQALRDIDAGKNLTHTTVEELRRRYGA